VWSSPQSFSGGVCLFSGCWVPFVGGDFVLPFFFFWFFCLFSVMSYFSEWLSLLETTSRVFVETFVLLFRSFFHFPLNFGRIETTVVFGAAYQLPFSHGKPFNHLSFWMLAGSERDGWNSAIYEIRTESLQLRLFLRQEYGSAPLEYGSVPFSVQFYLSFCLFFSVHRREFSSSNILHLIFLSENFDRGGWDAAIGGTLLRASGLELVPGAGMVVIAYPSYLGIQTFPQIQIVYFLCILCVELQAP
jgi:hypothetical protein